MSTKPAPMRRPLLWGLLAFASLAAGTAVIFARAGASGVWRAERVDPSAGGRHPALFALGEDVIVAWLTAPTPSNAKYGALVGYRFGWPVHYLPLARVGPDERRTPQVFEVPLGRGGSTYGRVCMVSGGSVVVAYPRYVVDGGDVALGVVSTATVGGEPVLSMPPQPVSVVPHCAQGVRGIRPAEGLPPSLRDWFIYPVLPERSLARPDLTLDAQKATWHLCGEDHAAGTVWSTWSEDLRWWAPLVELAKGPACPSVAARDGHVIVTFTQGSEYLYQNLWWDDRAPENRRDYFIVGRGLLMCRVSPDGGRTWGESVRVADSSEVVSSQCAWGPDGTVWVGYVQWLPVNGPTAIFLTSSNDMGETWSAPRQITSGEWIDRDVDLLVHDGQILVAFSRCLREGDPTRIWLWREEL